MAINEAVTVTYTAWDTANNEPKVGDVANHTTRYIKDGVAASPAAVPIEVEGGEYKVALAAGENVGEMMALIGTSTTPNIVIVKTSWQNIDLVAIADGVLSRDVSNVEVTAPTHSLCAIVLAALKSSIAGNTLTIKRTDGVTFAIKPVTKNRNANPITSVG